MGRECNILFPQGRGYQDVDGCMLPEAHNGPHRFIDIEGRTIEWEDDYSCTCGCWDEWEQYGETPCLISQEINTPNNQHK